MYSGCDTPKGWVAPFGHPGIKACSQLPRAFRSVPRPSSPLGAKASTRCPSHAHNTPGPSPQGEQAPPTMHRNHPRPKTQDATQTQSHSRPIHSSPTPSLATYPLSTHINASEPCNRTSTQSWCLATPQPGSDTHASTATDTPTQPQSTKHATRTRPAPRPPEMSCAPRNAPEPDSQSPKNTHKPSQPGWPTGHASNPRALQEPTPAGPISCRRSTQKGAATFSMMTSPGGGGRDRTDDPLLAKQVLSQLSYAPNTGKPRPTRAEARASHAKARASAELVGQGGLEPPTPRLSSVCSNQLSY